MKHVSLVLGSGFAGSMAIALLVVTRARPNAALYTIVGLVVLAIALAIPAQFSSAVQSLAAGWRAVKNPQAPGGGA